MFSRTLTAVTAFSTATLLSTAAFAGCGPTACGTSHGAVSHHSSGAQYGGVKTHTTHRTSSSTLAGSSTANCPSGTMLQSDGTCLAGESFGSSSSLGSSTTYSSGSSYDAGSINSQLSSIGSGTSYTTGATYSAPASHSMTTTHSAPSYSAPSYSAPSYAAPSYSAPSYAAPSYAAPSYSNPTTVISGSSNGSGSASYTSSVGGSSGSFGSGTSYSSSVGSMPSTSVTSNGAGSYTITSGGSSNIVSTNGSGISYSSGQEYNGVSVPSLGSRFAGGSSTSGGYAGGSGDMSVSNSGSGSVSATYTDNSSNSYSNTNITVVPFSTGDSAPLSSSYTLPGLGASETLTPTSCPVAVHNPSGAKVLGCYSVSRPAPAPAPQVHYTRVVRPVVYVRYPVPTPVPYTVNVPYPVRVNGLRNVGYQTGFGGARFGGFGFNNGFAGGFGGTGFGGCGGPGATRYGDFIPPACR